MKINNLPATAKNYGYIVAREVDGEFWYWGAWNESEKANEVARDIGGIAITTDLID